MTPSKRNSGKFPDMNLYIHLYIYICILVAFALGTFTHCWDVLTVKKKLGGFDIFDARMV